MQTIMPIIIGAAFFGFACLIAVMRHRQKKAFARYRSLTANGDIPGLLAGATFGTFFLGVEHGGPIVKGDDGACLHPGGYDFGYGYCTDAHPGGTDRGGGDGVDGGDDAGGGGD